MFEDLSRFCTVSGPGKHFPDLNISEKLKTLCENNFGD
jgi:hypothetical protein